MLLNFSCCPLRTLLFLFAVIPVLSGCITTDAAGTIAATERDAEIESLKGELRRGNARIATLHAGIARLETERSAALETQADMYEDALQDAAIEKHNIGGIIFGLKNLRPDRWKDRHEVEQRSVAVTMSYESLPPAQRHLPG